MPVLTAFALLLSLALPLAAQNPNRPLDMAIDASVRTRVIDGVLGRLNEGYVFPQMAAEMERAVRALAQRGAYDSIVSARAFAGGLTRDLQAVSRDRHLEVTYARDGDLPTTCRPRAGARWWETPLAVAPTPVECGEWTSTFGIWIPSGRAVNPRTGTNWEGIGIRPDIPVPAAEALRTAHLRALEGLLAAQREPERQAQLRQALEEVRRS